jgi:hypothetical protein
MRRSALRLVAFAARDATVMGERGLQPWRAGCASPGAARCGLISRTVTDGLRCVELRGVVASNHPRLAVRAVYCAVKIPFLNRIRSVS